LIVVIVGVSLAAVSGRRRRDRALAARGQGT
jgi:hypothetical protein